MKTRPNFTLSIALLFSTVLFCMSCDSTIGTEEAGLESQSVELNILNNISFGESVPLLAGQNIEAGEITVRNNGTELMVTYRTNSDWALTETHLAVGTEMSQIPRTKKGSPKVGKFNYKSIHDPAVIFYSYTIPLSEFDVSSGEDLIIAAHAVVHSAEVVIEAEAPFCASSVLDVHQGTKLNGNPVEECRCCPENGLACELGSTASCFFTLGFGGDISLIFDYPIINGPGNDIRVVETTWPDWFPKEKADIYVSHNAEEWELLGEACNSQDEGFHRESFLDLDEIGWDSALYVKVVDTTDPNLFWGDADGFDLNAVEALHDVVRITLREGDETAWGAGERFVARGNWATYFTYTIE